MEESLRRHDRMLPDEEGHPPVFTTEFKVITFYFSYKYYHCFRGKIFEIVFIYIVFFSENSISEFMIVNCSR